MARRNQTRAEEKMSDDPIKVEGSAGPAPGYTPAGGPRLTEFLDGLPLTSRWIHHHRVVWQTGQQNAPEGQGPEAETHCSAFIAAAALMLDIYVLRPPNHGQELLANAQAAWLAGEATYPGPTAAASGWIALGSSGDPGALKAAVDAANLGRLVVGVYKAPSVRKPDGKLHQVPGHTCIVRPQSAAAVGDDGPRVMCAADVNRTDTPMQTAFHAHPEAWPDRIALYACPTDLEKDAG
jgi:hypothetical protein